ncbi:MAG: hypothetical protein E3J65_06915 [Dehalococcoidia bacterium]|nr:MAG: hypothetical protein E3J65_06915 [Dehalococcoidia bacterium]
MEYNTFIDKRDLALLRKETGEIERFDSYLRRQLSDKAIDGLKAWEYGKVTNIIRDFRGLRVLDVGSGDSTFCVPAQKESSR